MAAREITLQLPEDIYQQLTKVAQRSHQSVNEIAMQSLQVGLSQNLYHPLEGGYDIQLTRTWTMRGSLEISGPEAKYITGEDKEGNAITNYAENIDDVLYS
jgi:hypothetical protein